MPERRRAALEGLLAAGLGVALDWAISAPDPALPFAPVALADRGVRLTSGELETFAIERLGHAALPLLAVGATVGFLLLGAGLGLAIASRRARAPSAAGLAFAATLASAELAAPARPPVAAALASAAAGGALYSATLLGVRRRRRRAGFDPGRRRLLVELGAGTASLLVGGTALGRLFAPSTRAPVGGLRRPPTPSRRPLPHIDGLAPEVTPVASHYVVDIDLNDPAPDARDWQLSVEGLVEQPLRLDFEELQRRFPLVGEYSVLTCISNHVGGPLVGNSLWHGVRLGELLGAAAPRDRGREVVFHCADGYSAAIPLQQALHPSVLVAIAQNGRSLTREHGFPCRLRVPALYGIKNPKWLERISLTDHHFEGYWQRQGWTDTALVRTESRIDAPGDTAAGEPTWIAGIAWAGLRGIATVELSTDAGRTWHRAELQRPLSPYAWTRWAYRWTPPRPGLYELVCRATDGDGRQQDSTPRPPHPSGASGYHRRELEVA